MFSMPYRAISLPFLSPYHVFSIRSKEWVLRGSGLLRRVASFHIDRDHTQKHTKKGPSNSPFTSQFINRLSQSHMVAIGDKIDIDFSLKVVENGGEREVRFGDLLTHPTVVTVYMKNNTSSCDLQNVTLIPVAEELSKKGIRIISMSKDGCKSHINYAAKHGIPFTLASDPDYLFAKATDSMVEKKMYGKVFHAPSRSAYYIDTDGTVLGVIEKVTPASHGEEIVALVS